MVAAFLAAWNVIWVSVGFPLEPRDNNELWEYHRRRASTAGEGALVFTGTSRIKAGIDLEEARRQTEKTPVQLAISGKSPVPVLQHLAEDDSFKGTVVAEITEYTVYNQSDDDSKRLTSKNEENVYVNDYVFPLKSFAQSLVAAPNLGNTTSEVLTTIFTGKVFDREYLNWIITHRPPTTSFNRSSQGYADEATPERIEQRRQFALGGIKQIIARGTPDKAKFAKTARRIEDYTRRIQERGGKVILVNFPLNGEVKELNEKYFPKSDFWNVLAAISSAETVYYADYPSLAAIETLDGTHFSGSNATLFTRELFNIINRSNRQHSAPR